MKQIQEQTNSKEKIARKSPMNLTDSDQEMLNLDKELYSLTHYADDPEELVSQMFSTIKGTKLNAMLPPILKEIPLIDVQQLCLHELRGMSSRRILSVINGVEMSDSSSDEDELLEQKTDRIKDEQNTKDDSMDIDLNSLKDLVNDPNLTEMDMLELEMRAKLIKTMLDKQPGEDSSTEDKSTVEFDPNIKIKQEPLSSDDERKSRQRKYRDRSGSSSSSSSSSSRSYSSYSSSSSSERTPRKSKINGRRSSEEKETNKKKITKKEFEARMKKAKMNRSYRKRKDSEDESPNESKRRHRRRKSKKNGVENPEDGNEAEMEATTMEEANEEVSELKSGDDQTASEPVETVVEGSPAQLEVPEQEPVEEEEEEEEKEEGEIDSNEEQSADNRSRSRSRSYSGSSSGSYSHSPRRRHRHKKKHSKRYKSKSPSVPKVPNWEEGSQTALPRKSGKGGADEEQAQTLPLNEDRQSVSFALSKKNAPVSTPNPNLHDEPVVEKKMEGGAGETNEDFYKGADQLSFSEEEGALPDESDAEVPDEEVEKEDETAEEAVPTSEPMDETSQMAEEPEEGEDNDEDQTQEETTEIIGIIDPTAEMSIKDLDGEGSNWSTRWLQSEKVQQVVSDSKMLSKVRKNIQAKGKVKPKKSSVQIKSKSVTKTGQKTDTHKVERKLKKPTGGIGGNAEEYENTFGIKVKVPQSLPVPKPAKSSESENKSKSLAATLLDSDGDDEDSEDDDLWSKIMKK